MVDFRYQCERNVCQSELERIRMKLHNLFPHPQQNYSQSYQNEINPPCILYPILEEKLRKCLKKTKGNDYKKSRLLVRRRRWD